MQLHELLNGTLLEFIASPRIPADLPQMVRGADAGLDREKNAERRRRFPCLS